MSAFSTVERTCAECGLHIVFDTVFNFYDRITNTLVLRTVKLLEEEFARVFTSITFNLETLELGTIIRGTVFVSGHVDTFLNSVFQDGHVVTNLTSFADTLIGVSETRSENVSNTNIILQTVSNVALSTSQNFGNWVLDVGSTIFNCLQGAFFFNENIVTLTFGASREIFC